MATPQEIDQASQCYCLSNYERAVLYLLDQNRIAQGGAVMTVQEIDAASQCYCISNFEKAVLYLLANGGGGGGGGGESGAGSPEGVVTASPGTTYLNTTDNSFWVKATGTGTNTGWIPLIV